MAFNIALSASLGSFSSFKGLFMGMTVRMSHFNTLYTLCGEQAYLH